MNIQRYLFLLSMWVGLTVGCAESSTDTTPSETGATDPAAADASDAQIAEVPAEETTESPVGDDSVASAEDAP